MTGLLLGLGVLALSLVALVLWIRSRSRRARAQITDELMTEPALRGPEPALYRGGSVDTAVTAEQGAAVEAQVVVPD